MANTAYVIVKDMRTHLMYWDHENKEWVSNIDDSSFYGDFWEMIRETQVVKDANGYACIKA